MKSQIPRTLSGGALALVLSVVGITDASAQLIDTYAGRGPYIAPITASAANITPWPIALAPSGSVYFADHNSVYRYDPNAATVTTVAGNHTNGYSGDTGPATNAQIGPASGLALDSSGNLYIADFQHCVVRKVTPSGIISTFAGNGVCGVAGDGSLAVNAQLSYPYYLHVDATGNLLIADWNYGIRTVNLATGIISTVSNTANTFPVAVTGDAAGNIYFIFSYGNFSGSGVPRDVLYKLTPGGAPAPLATLQYCSEGLTIDAGGNLYTADWCANDIYRISSTGTVSIVAGTDSGGFSPDGTLATAAKLGDPADVALDAAGTVYFTDFSNFRVRHFQIGGTLTTIAGTNNGLGGPAQDADIRGNSAALASDSSGNLYVSGYKVSPFGVISEYLGTGGPGFTGDGGLAVDALASAVTGVAVDVNGNIFIADGWNNRIRKIDTSGIINTIAGNGAFTNTGDGGPASAATLAFPGPIAVDGAGNVFVGARQGPGRGANVFRKIGTNGVIGVVAGSYTASGYAGDNGPATAALLNRAEGIAADGGGNLYIADTGNNVIRMVTPGGIITTVAGTGVAGFAGDGGLATGAQLNRPAAVVVDSAGNIYIADSTNNRIRKVTGGVITTVVGTGVAGLSGDGGQPTAAQLNNPRDLSIDGSGTLYVNDSGNNRVRRIRFGAVAQNPIYGIGDLPGGAVYSEVRDATKVGGVIMAVGASSRLAGSVLSDASDTGILWTSTGGLVALPAVVPNDTSVAFTAGRAITRDGTTIGGSAHDGVIGVNTNHRTAVLVTNNGTTNTVLGSLFSVGGNSAVNALSDDGSSAYGFSLDGVSGSGHAFRWTAGTGLVDLGVLNAGDDSLPAPRGTSSDGSVMVGTSGVGVFNNSSFLGSRAFRYVEGSGMTALPLLTGGTGSEALSVTPDGNVSLGAGDSTAFPNGELIRWNESAGTTEALGSPDPTFSPGSVGGITADAQVAVVALVPASDPTAPGYAVAAIDPLGAYLPINTNPSPPNPPDAANAPLAVPLAPFGLSSLGLGSLTLQVTGTMSYCAGCAETIAEVCGVFSASASVADAIAPDFGTASGCVTGPTLFDSLPSDIAQDFLLDGSTVPVPAGANYLIVAVADTFYADNSSTAGLSLAITPHAGTQNLGGSYLRNSHGWFSLPSALVDAGIDLTGWTLDGVFAVTPDGTLPFGSGRHNGNVEGWVAEVPVNYLRDYATDHTPPVITPIIIGTLGANAWYTSNVSVTWTVTDVESAITTKTGCDPGSVTADTTGITFTCSATSAGGIATLSVIVKRDTTIPLASAAALPVPNGNGWNNSNVTVTFTGSDVTSLIASCTASGVLSAEGVGQSASGTCTDNAGNVSATTTASGINIDKTAPSALITIPANGASYTQGTVVNASFSCTDALSGVAQCVGSVANGAAIDTATTGNKTFSVNAADLSGNPATVSTSYTVTAGGGTPPTSGTTTAANCVTVGGCDILGGLIPHKVVIGTQTVSGTVFEESCVVNTDPRITQYGTCTGHTLPVAQVCPGFGNTVIPASLCGGSGASGSAFALVKAIADGVDSVPGLLVYSETFADKVAGSANNPPCPQTSVGWAPRSNSTEGTVVEGDTMLELTGGCGSSRVISRGLSIYAIGLKLNTDALPPGATPVQRLVGYADQKFNFLRQAISPTNANIAALTRQKLAACVVRAKSHLDAGRQVCAARKVWRCDQIVANNAAQFGSSSSNPNPYGDARARLANLFLTIDARILGHVPATTWPLASAPARCLSNPEDD